MLFASRVLLNYPLPDPEVTAQHRALLEAHLYSFEKLELLHALRSAGRPVSRDELVTVARLDRDVVADVLAQLELAHLVELDASGKLASLGVTAREPICESLLALYQADRAAVMAVVSSIAVRRIRSMAADAFADAFVLRKKKRGPDG